MVMPIEELDSTLDSPKSPSLNTPIGLTKILAGFISLCIILFILSTLSASHSSMPSLMISLSLI